MLDAFDESRLVEPVEELCALEVTFGKFARATHVEDEGRTIENLQTASNEQGITLWQAACNAGAKATKIAAFVRLIEALRNQKE